eukprot:7013078-Prymnesium_polylepis.1
MANILKAFEKCLASIVQVSPSSERCANAVRAPTVPPSRCVHRLPLALAHSVLRATCSRFPRRTAAADTRRLVPARMLARRPPSTTTATARPGCARIRGNERTRT